MKDLNLEKYLETFLDTYVPKDMPYLLAISGGIDSTALLYAVASVSKDRRPHVVHIDHGWREASHMEKEELGKKVALLNIPFHSFRLQKSSQGVNLEEWSRMQRIRCFSELGKTIGTTIILLAHHADDQLEVVLKRMLEGSSIINFRGMRVIEEREGLVLMRPFLSFRKKELLQYLEKKNISFFDDPTNRDPKFLRARFRTQLLPSLRESFGKEFEESVLRVSEEALLLEEWVQQSLTENFAIGCSEGLSFATSKQPFPPAFLLHYLVDMLRKKCGLPAPSRSQVSEAAAHFLEPRSGSRSFPVGEGIILVEHNWIGVFAKRLEPLAQFFCDQDQGVANLSCWEIVWKDSIIKESVMHTWTDLFQGKSVSIYIPKQPFTISPSSDRLLKTVKGKAPSPTSFRSFVPAIIQQDQLVADFLTGYSLKLPSQSPCYEVTIRFK